MSVSLLVAMIQHYLFIRLQKVVLYYYYMWMTMLITGDDSDHISQVKKHFSKEFSMYDLGVLLVVSWVLRSYRPQKDFIYHNPSTSKMFLIALVLLILALL
jgi:hypothetical protein